MKLSSRAVVWHMQRPNPRIRKREGGIRGEQWSKTMKRQRRNVTTMKKMRRKGETINYIE